MTDGRRPSSQRIRKLILSLERLLAEGVASGAVRGAASEFESLERVEDSLQALLENVLVVLNRLAETVAAEPRPPGAWPEQVAAGAVRGVFDEVQRSAPLAVETAREVLVRLDAALDRMAAQAEARASSESSPASKAHAVTTGAIAGLVEELHDVRAELASFTSELSLIAGRDLANGFIQAIAAALRDQGELRRVGRDLLSAGTQALRKLVRGPAGVIGAAAIVVGLAGAVAFTRR